MNKTSCLVGVTNLFHANAIIRLLKVIVRRSWNYLKFNFQKTESSRDRQIVGFGWFI